MRDVVFFIVVDLCLGGDGVLVRVLVFLFINFVVLRRFFFFDYYLFDCYVIIIMFIFYDCGEGLRKWCV